MQLFLGTRGERGTMILFHRIRYSYRHISEGLHAMDQSLLQGYEFWLSLVEIHPHVDLNSFYMCVVELGATFLSLWLLCDFFLGLQKKNELSLIWVSYQLSAGGTLATEINTKTLFFLSYTDITGMQLRGKARPSAGKRRDWNKGTKAQDKICSVISIKSVSKSMQTHQMHVDNL